VKYITIDPYYGLDFFHQTINALKNNGVKYSLFASIKPPYMWYFEIQDKDMPTFINYDELSDQRFLVNITQASNTSQEVALYRRQKTTEGAKYITNDAFSYCKNYCVFLNIKSQERLQELSKKVGKIFYLGKYYSGKYWVSVTNNINIKNFVPREEILLEVQGGRIGEAEVKFNWNVMALKDRLKKFVETPYFENGKYNIPAILGRDPVKYIKF
jgi:hypothetical protein